MLNMDLEKAEEPEIKLLTSVGSLKKQESSRKSIYFCFIHYAKAFGCVDHNKLWKILKEMGISDHLTCLLRNLYTGQEAKVRTGHGTSLLFHVQFYLLFPAYRFLKRQVRWSGIPISFRIFHSLL